jgi:hypothetical protein
LKNRIKSSLLWLASAASLASVALTLTLTSKANAYYSTLDTGDVLNEGEYQVMLSPQLVFNQYDGANFSGRLDMGLMEGVSARGILGFGKVDFQIGGLVKWIPFPDADGQPAIGGEAGVLIARIGSVTQYSLRVHPLISKKLETEIGDVSPYLSLPLGITIQSGGNDQTFVPVQLVVGSELRPLEMPKWGFFGEVGLNMSKSFGYATVGVAYRFDDTKISGSK